jgi:hypothetical protein
MKKMFNVTNHHRNMNQNHSEITPDIKDRSVNKDVEKREPLDTADENVK